MGLDVIPLGAVLLQKLNLASHLSCSLQKERGSKWKEMDFNDMTQRLYSSILFTTQ